MTKSYAPVVRWGETTGGGVRLVKIQRKEFRYERRAYFIPFDCIRPVLSNLKHEISTVLLDRRLTWPRLRYYLLRVRLNPCLSTTSCKLHRGARRTFESIFPSSRSWYSFNTGQRSKVWSKSRKFFIITYVKTIRNLLSELLIKRVFHRKLIIIITII